jgi:hypothetical protein
MIVVFAVNSPFLSSSPFDGCHVHYFSNQNEVKVRRGNSFNDIFHFSVIITGGRTEFATTEFRYEHTGRNTENSPSDRYIRLGNNISNPEDNLIITDRPNKVPNFLCLQSSMHETTRRRAMHVP